MEIHLTKNPNNFHNVIPIIFYRASVRGRARVAGNAGRRSAMWIASIIWEGRSGSSSARDTSQKHPKRPENVERKYVSRFVFT
jgi:hypothetical protein